MEEDDVYCVSHQRRPAVGTWPASAIFQEASIPGRVMGVNDGALESRVFHLSLASWDGGS
jgi:hypothetical protein